MDVRVERRGDDASSVFHLHPCGCGHGPLLSTSCAVWSCRLARSLPV